MDETLRDRCLDFEVGLHSDAAEQVERTDWGLACLNLSIPRVWDANWVLIEQPGLAAEEIVAITDEVIGGAGMEHRVVVIEGAADGERLVPEFDRLGDWEPDHGVEMVLRGKPAEPAIEVFELDLDGVREGRRQFMLADLSADIGLDAEDAPAVIEQLLEWDRRIGLSGGDRWFTASYEGEPAAFCRLFAREGIGQVEDVCTLPHAREQGLARAVVSAAARASIADGNEMTFLGALVDDWPKTFYARLGFEEVGLIYGFRRKPGR